MKQWILVLAEIYHKYNCGKEGIKTANRDIESIAVDGRRKTNNRGRKRKSKRETVQQIGRKGDVHLEFK